MPRGEASGLPGQKKAEKSDYDDKSVYGFVYKIFI
jgi:hypothetical protein